MSGVIQAASTDQYTAVKLWTSADGLPKTDATHSTSGLSIKYQIGNAAVQSVTVAGSPAPASMSAGGAHADWGIYHRGNGWYVIGLADAVIATAGSRISVWIELTDCDSAPAEIYVSGYDGSAVAVGGSTFDHTSDEVTTDAASRTASQADVSGLATAANLATVAGYLDTEIAAILADTNELQTNQGNWITATGFSTHDAASVVSAMLLQADDFKADVSGLATAASIAELNDFDPTTDTVARVTLVDTTTVNTDMRGTENAALAATALSNVVWTDTKAGYIDAAITSISAGSGPTAAEISLQIAGDIEDGQNNWDTAAAELGGVTATQIERNDGMLKALADRFFGITSWPNWVRAFVRSSTPDATALAEINAGGGDFDSATDSLQAGAGGGGSTLTGPNVVTVTVVNDDDSTTVENALVRIYKSGASETKVTAADGTIDPFAVESATWNLAVSAAGFASQVVEVVVSDDVTQVVRLVVDDGGVYSSAGWIG